MSNSIVRIKSITIKNFKNVIEGKISFENNRKNYKASILGLYGQNGSGKTALIDALSLLKYILSGQSVPCQYADCINVGSKIAELEYDLYVFDEEKNATYSVNYKFSLKKDSDVSVEKDSQTDIFDSEDRAVIFDEVLSYSYECGEEKKRMSQMINTKTDEVFIPKSKYVDMTGNNNTIDLMVAKKMALSTSKSFIFSNEIFNSIRKNCSGSQYEFLMNSLAWYGKYKLFVIDTKNMGLISLDALPLSFRYADDNMRAVGNLAIPLSGSKIIPQKAYDVVNTVIQNMNIVLSQLIPNLTIDVKIVGMQIMKNGENGIVIELVSNKNNKEIPLRYESEGIKKIISILQLLIVVYNNKSVTVAIDELDSGVFEYLLGEILRIISEKGKGQLIFTSHNLRPLETIDRGFVAFTTTNPKNRYIRFSNVKTNHNLRDFYYRDIILGEQNEPVYEVTNNHEISLAFREAGEMCGS